MTEKEELAQLKAQVAALMKRAEAGPVDSREAERQALVAEVVAKKKAMKEATKKEGGYAIYRIPIGAPMYYRQGHTVAPGNLVRIPVDEEPSALWEAVEVAKPAEVLVSKPVGTEKKRDRDVA